jgi:hypothetical protein
MQTFSSVEMKKMARSHFVRDPLVDILIAAVLIAALAVEFYAFARVQDIWADETTQLSALSLDFWGMLRWLAGADPDRLVAPLDRMPPVSYMLDWLWLHFHGSSEIGFRLFHAAFVIAGTSCLATVVWRELGRSAMIVSLGFLVLSPKLIQTGVEIRAYPIFFALTCAQAAVFLRLVASPTKIDRKLLTLFAAICLLAVYTHFYGIVSSCAFFLALGISLLRRPMALGEITCAFLVVVIGSLGLMPFVSAAAQKQDFLSATAAGLVTTDKSAIRYLSYLLKLVGDSANMVSISASILFFGGAIALLAATTFAAARRIGDGEPKPFDWLVAVVISGILATVAASWFVARFDALKTSSTFNALTESYSVWLMVPISVLIGAGAVSATGFRAWDIAGRRVAVSALLIGAAMSTYLFFNHATLFVHGPRRFIGALYDKAAAPKAVVYEAGAGWGWSYVPLQYSHHGEVVQYRVSDDGSGLVRPAPRGSEETVGEIEATVAPYQTLLLTDIRLRSYRDLRQCADRPSACPDFPKGMVERALIGTGKWREIGKERAFGLWDSEVTILERSQK